MKRLSPKQLEAARLVAEGKFFPDLVREDDGWHARWFAGAVVVSYMVLPLLVRV